MLIYFLSFLKPHVKWQILLFVLMGIGSASSLATPYFLKIIIDDIFPHKTYHDLIRILYILVFIYLLRISISILSDILYTKISKNVISDMRVDVFSRILQKDLNFFRENKSGEIVFLLTNDIGNIQNIISTQLLGFINNIFTIVSVLFMLFTLNIKLTWISLTVIPVIVLNLKLLIPYVRKTFQEIQTEESKIYDYLMNCINNIRVILSYGTRKFENSRIKIMHEKLIKVSVKASTYNSVSNNITTFLIAIGPIVVLFIGGKMVFKTELTIGSLIAFIQYLNRIYSPVISLSNTYNDFEKAKVSMQRIYKHISLEPPIEHHKTVIKSHLELSLIPIEKIEFKNVCFIYEDKIILENINLTLEKGKIYGVLGESGSGKSTLVNLLCKLEKPTFGEILCNGNINLESFYNWSDYIALIERENQLFNDTIENNIHYGLSKLSTYSIDEVILDAEMQSVINEKKDGLSTLVSNYSTVISDGQKQRISIARALLKNPSVIIFDEATSALDVELEKRIFDTLRKKYSNSIIIIVTHRHNLLRNFDDAYYVSDKKINLYKV